MYLCVFCIALVRKNGPGRFPELKLTINQSSINQSMVMNVEEADTEPWGLTIFFWQHQIFLRDLQRKFKLCS